MLRHGLIYLLKPFFSLNEFYVRLGVISPKDESVLGLRQMDAFITPLAFFLRFVKDLIYLFGGQLSHDERSANHKLLFFEIAVVPF